MEEKVIDFMMDRPIIIPRFLFKNYKKLNISEEELIVLIYIIDMGTKVVYNPDIFVRDLCFDKYRVMEIISNLVEKKFISVVVEKDVNKRSEEYICVDLLYNRLFNVVFVNEEEEVNNSDIFSLFQNEFGRPISPMEYEIIKGWLNDKFSEELITEALKEAVYNNVNSLRYIDKILYEWKKKGIKSKKDIANVKKGEQSKNEEVFDYDWLNE